jgi:hypothetical protein
MSDNRTQGIKVYVTPDERDEFTREATERGEKVGPFMRRATLALIKAERQ